jgi:phenylacetate-CoA ligase
MKMIDTAFGSAALAFWLAREARPTFGMLRRPAVELERLARNRLRRTLEYAGQTAFGARRLAEAGTDGAPSLNDPEAALQALRPVAKEEMRAAGHDALLGGRERATWRSSRSSGSTGEPFRVFYDARAWAILKYLVKLRARAACGVRWSHRVALLDAIPPADEGLLALERMGRVRRISVLQSAERVAARLAAFRPHVVYGLPSALLEVGHRLSGAHDGLSVSAVFTSGELLDGDTRRMLGELFGGAVFDVYGSSETKEVAWECREGGMHINQDVTRVEVLDPDDNRLPEGAEGEIVVTLLVNRAMPIVRYRTGDLGSLLPGGCPCGLALPRLGVVTGREADVLNLSGGRRVSPYAITCALETVPGVMRYQVSQLGPEQLRVRARIASPATSDDPAADIRGALQRAIPGPLTIGVEFVDRFDTGPRAKFRVVQPGP